MKINHSNKAKTAVDNMNTTSQRSVQCKKMKEWTPKDTKSLYPSLTDDEAKMAWEMGW